MSFATEGGGAWKEWDRYLMLEGKKAFHIGNVCETCTFFFQRMGGANASVNPEGVVEALAGGLTALDSPVIEQVQKIMPKGDYIVSLHEAEPTLVAPGDPADYFVKEQQDLWGVDSFWGLPHHPKTEYYRTQNMPLGNGRCLFEFLVPMFPHNWLDTRRVAEMKRRIGVGVAPTAVALSVLDVKQPADWDGDPDINAHYCLAHYLLDGHHKTYAASQEKRPVSVVAFLAMNEGVSSHEQKEAIMENMKAQQCLAADGEDAAAEG